MTGSTTINSLKLKNNYTGGVCGRAVVLPCQCRVSKRRENPMPGPVTLANLARQGTLLLVWCRCGPAPSSRPARASSPVRTTRPEGLGNRTGLPGPSLSHGGAKKNPDL